MLNEKRGFKSIAHVELGCSTFAIAGSSMRFAKGGLFKLSLLTYIRTNAQHTQHRLTYTYTYKKNTYGRGIFYILG